MPKFRKKPIVVEAVQFTGDNFEEVQSLTGPGLFMRANWVNRIDDPEIVAQVFDRLHSTWVGVKIDQWIIRGVQGEFYPCDPDVLIATYDPAGEQDDIPELLVKVNASISLEQMRQWEAIFNERLKT